SKDKGSYVIGLILNPPLSADKSKIHVKITEFGTYQAAYLATEVKEAPQDVTTQKQITNATGSPVAPTSTAPVTYDPGFFEIADFKSPTNQSQVTIKWSKSDHAVSYNL